MCSLYCVSIVYCIILQNVPQMTVSDDIPESASTVIVESSTDEDIFNNDGNKTDFFLCWKCTL